METIVLTEIEIISESQNPSIILLLHVHVCKFKVFHLLNVYSKYFVTLIKKHTKHL